MIYLVVIMFVITVVLFVYDLVVHGNPLKTKPTAPTSGLSFPKGESVMNIIYRGVEVPPNTDPDQGVTKTRVLTLVDGTEGPATEQIISGNGGKVDIIVPDGSKFKSWYHYVDAAGNASDPSPETIIEKASDETPPTAPKGGMSFPKGEALPD